MRDVKKAVAANLSRLRLAHGMTQLELAERLNYSDKAVSKWERGESLPDVGVLTEIADLFEVPLDSLVREDMPQTTEPPKKHRYSRRVITGVSVVLVWLIATAAFVLMSLLPVEGKFAWLSFVVAVPPSLVVWLVLNTLWFRPRWNYLIISLLVWAVLAVVYLVLLSFGYNVWLIFLLGIPAQVIVLLWSRMKKK